MKRRILTALLGLGALRCADPAPAWRFVERLEGSGIDFLDTHGRVGLAKEDLIETLGGGVGMIDYDADGDLDLFFANGDPWDGAPPGASRLYRNDGDFHFSDVTSASGIDLKAAAAGVAVGDVDRDGRDDLFVSGFGGNTLWHNLGNGKFEEIGQAAGVSEGGIGASAAFADLDADGDLDLFVCAYITWDDKAKELSRKGGMFRGQKVIFGPRGFEFAFDTLFANRVAETGRLEFEDVTTAAGLAHARSYALGVVASDIDDDGDVDLYVANDSEANSLFVNDGKMHFVDRAAESGTAYDMTGKAQAGMGVDCRDVDGDGADDLFVTNFSHDYNTLYRNLGNGFFEDASRRYGLIEPSFLMLAWGCALFDGDLDGDVDLVVANGHVFPNMDSTPLNTRYAQPNQLFENVDGQAFVEVPEPFVPTVPAVSRGLAVGDLDGDGREDLVFTRINGPPSLLRNESRTGSSVVLHLVGTTSNSNAIGARIEAVVDGGRPRVLRVLGGGSYQSASSLDVVIGLGSAKACRSLSIRWPSGSTQTLGPVQAGQRIVVHEGRP
jgi:enediyne biosynthesis protein E4